VRKKGKRRHLENKSRILKKERREGRKGERSVLVMWGKQGGDYLLRGISPVVTSDIEVFSHHINGCLVDAHHLVGSLGPGPFSQVSSLIQKGSFPSIASWSASI
jgi:hypothetical protein